MSAEHTQIVRDVIQLLSVIVTCYFAFLIAKTNKVVTEVHLAVNSKMERLLELTETAATAKGHLVGVAEEKQRWNPHTTK
jgi:hypothetical protein